MESHRFDNLARSYATSRRGFVKTLAGAAFGGLLGGRLDHGAAAAPACRGAGHPCEGNQICCAGLICVASGPGAALRCTPCPAGQIACGDACIPACTAIDVCHVAGVCDPASGACTNPPAAQGTSCGQGPRCSAGVATGPDTCDGNGNCAAGPTTTCAPYVCGSTSCLTSCTSNVDCASGNACNGSGNCAACTPDCAGKCLGAPDGCGGTCTGSCGASERCSNGTCIPLVACGNPVDFCKLSLSSVCNHTITGTNCYCVTTPGAGAACVDTSAACVTCSTDADCTNSGFAGYACVEDSCCSGGTACAKSCT